MRNTMIKKLLLNQGKYEAVEGIPPLTLEKSLGKNLRDYKIYGNSIQNGTPTPDTPIEVESVGEKTINKFENVQVVNSSAVNRENYKNGITATTKSDGGYSNYVAMNLLKDGEFEWGKTYTVSCFAEQTNSDMGSLMRVGYFRTTQNTWRSIKDITIKNNQTNTLTFTLPSEVPEDFGENEYYSNNNIQMLFNVQVTQLGELGTLTVTDIMAVDGDTATPYEPYGKYKIPIISSASGETIETNIYLDEPLRKIGEYADCIDFENGVVVRNIKSLILDGSYEIGLPSWRKIDGYYAVGYGNSIIPNILKATSSKTKGFLLCKQLPNISYEEIYSNPLEGVAVFYGPAYSIFIRIKTDTITTKEQFIEWLNKNPLNVYYATNTPAEELIELPKLPTLKGTTVLDTNTNLALSNMSVVYKRR